MEEKLHLDEALLILKDIYENRMPFDRLLGVRVSRLPPDDIEVSIDMRDDLVGNFVRNMLHGGVISAVLDLTGGLITSVEMLKQLNGKSTEEIAGRLTRIGTIDLRVDYLRAGKGKYFRATGSVLRQGNRVAVIRTELHNDHDLLIAAGTGTYQVG